MVQSRLIYLQSQIKVTSFSERGYISKYSLKIFSKNFAAAMVGVKEERSFNFGRVDIIWP